MDKFKVTKHFKVYGNKTGGGSCYNCSYCDWKGTAFTDAQAHYEGRHLNGAVPHSNGATPEPELTPEQAAPALNYLARRVVALEGEVAGLQSRNAQLLEALDAQHKKKLSKEFWDVYGDSQGHPDNG